MDRELPYSGRAFPVAVMFGVSGALGACTSGVLLYPLDTVRTRLQVQTGAAMKEYKGVLSAFRVMLRDEHIRAFYRGLPIHVAALSTWAFLYFGAYNTLKRSLPMDEDHPLQQATAAGASWIVSVAATNPLWIVKTRAQVHRQPFSLGKAAREFVGLWRAGKMMVGVNASMFGAVTVMIQLPLYEQLKYQLSSRAMLLDPSDPTRLSPLGYFTCSTLSMTASSLLTYPQDVIRARVQGTTRYTGAADCIRKTIMEESVRGLYAGLGAHLTRLLPTSAITFIVYEWTCKFLAKSNKFAACNA